MELLAPAGNKSAFFTAVNSGANAVYLGLEDFNARRSAENFNTDNLAFYTAYAHIFGVKVYITLNTLVKNTELTSFFDILISAYNAGADAFIIQDIFLGKYIHETYPEIPLHLSTQAGVNNVEGATIAKEFGFSRVILARETGIDEIKDIAKIIDTEVFIHGAMCSSFSGHCYYSAFVGGNSGNRGMCKQPCRQPFEYFGNDKVCLGKYNLSLSDLKLCDYVKLLSEIGVASVKIEGRMRSDEYVAKSVSLYRKAIDGEDYLKDERELTRIYNRGNYSKGYVFDNKNVISDKIQSHMGEFYGKVVKVTKDEIKCDKNANEGDSFKIIRKGYEVGNCTVSNGKYIYKGKISVGDELYITKDILLAKNVIPVQKKKKLSISFKIKNGYMCVSYGENEYRYNKQLENSNNISITEKDVLDNFSKTDVYPFDVTVTTDVNSLRGWFVKKSDLNAFRREVFSKIFDSYSNKKDLKIIDNISDFKNYSNNLSDKTAAISSFDVCSDFFIYAPLNYSVKPTFKYKHESTFLFVPAFANTSDVFLIEKLISQFDGIYADGVLGLYLAKKHKKKLFVGLGLNVFNDLDVYFLKKEYPDAIIACSKELSQSELIKGTFVFSYGKTQVMEFIYCPFRNNCNICANEDYYSAKDSYDTFLLKRYRLSACRFMLYSGSVLRLKHSLSLCDLSGGSEQDYLNFISKNNLKSDKKAIIFKGVL